MSDDWRCFVAVPIGEDLRSGLAKAVAVLRQDRPELEESWRWNEPEAWHITLAFLGGVPSRRVLILAEALAGVCDRSAPFRVTSGGLGVFPSRRAARVLWYGINDPNRYLHDLARAVRTAVRLEEPSPFRAHLTLGRARHRHGAPVGTLLDAATLPTGELLVDRTILYRSHLGPGRTRYEALAEATLGGEPAALDAHAAGLQGP